MKWTVSINARSGTRETDDEDGEEVLAGEADFTVVPDAGQATCSIPRMP